MDNSQQKELTGYGEVVEVLPSLKFKVKLDDGREILAYLSGKLVMNRIRVLLGDRVTVEQSPYDLTRGRIVYRGVPKRPS